MEQKGILLVDDETLALKYFAKAFANRFPIYSASSAQEALGILDEHSDRIGVVVTDQRMPESTGIDLLRVVRNEYPNTARILTTAYTDLDVLIAAINVGAVHSFVTKPWDLQELETALLNALRHHSTPSHGLLLEQRLDALKNRVLDDKAYDIGLIAAKIGHYVHNALCPLTFLLDQLLDHDRTGVGYTHQFLQNVRTHIYDVARTLKDLEQASTPVAAEDCEMVDLEALLDKALQSTELIRGQKGLQLEKSSSGKVPPILGSPSQIEKLFRFMITEEIVSLPGNNLVRVELSPHEVDGEVLGANVVFEDFVPVPPNVQGESLLYPFNLRGSNPREFGVFLASCYFIARHHGGSLNVRVKEDQGILFSFFLPCDPQMVAHPEMDLLRNLSFNSTFAPPNHDR